MKFGRCDGRATMNADEPRTLLHVKDDEAYK